jgi:predicted flap endonuclease-1-like 5' DNA nuclease
MSYTEGLIAGLIIGWLIEWIFDWLFWRRMWRKQAAQTAMQTTSASSSRADKELTTYKARLADAEQTIDQLRSDLNRAAKQAALPEDRLERIKGLNTTSARRLQRGGIRTFTDLGAASPGQLKRIVKPETWQIFEPEKWIAEAKTLAKESAKSTSGARR